MNVNIHIYFRAHKLTRIVNCARTTGIAERNQFGTIANRLPELKDWRRRLQRGVDRLRDHLCRQFVLELIYYSEEPESQLSPEFYLILDNDGGDPDVWLQDPMPSPIFQVSSVAFTFK